MDDKNKKILIWEGWPNSSNAEEIYISEEENENFEWIPLEDVSEFLKVKEADKLKKLINKNKWITKKDTSKDKILVWKYHIIQERGLVEIERGSFIWRLTKCAGVFIGKILTFKFFKKKD